MEENENQDDVVVADVEVENEEDELQEPEDNDKTDWKAEAKKAHGAAKRYKTKLDKLKDGPKADEKKPSAKDKKSSDEKGFDYGQKAYLKASGITPDEFAFVQKVMVDTGKSLDDVLEAKYFQAELKEMREVKATKDAMPNASKRSGANSRDSVEYWVAKGELPPADQVELRRKVVNAKLAVAKQKSTFTDNSVVQ